MHLSCVLPLNHSSFLVLMNYKLYMLHPHSKCALLQNGSGQELCAGGYKKQSHLFY